ncbi:hypothetical protein ACSHT2_08660 [Bradyrhizobium sp. PUT101]|uniref:hypothetical protein n=1 Tax=Bradyrhizobium sp. PUT101 TaxID=3447427 RepID=UPI003F82C1BF
MELDRELNAMGAVLAALEPLDAEERARVVAWAMQKLSIQGHQTLKPNSPETKSLEPNDTVQETPVSSKGALWMRQNGLTALHLSEVFHFEDSGAEIIASEVPGSSTRDKVKNAYVLLGLSNFLVNGTPTVGDKAGRSVCERFGIYDKTNHSKAFKGGNELTGSANAGWTVTAPGLRHAATLVKQISKSDD